MGANKSKVRGRVNYISKKEYNLFKKKYPTTEITYEEFITILKQSTLCIKNTILENPLGFKLPNNIGYVAVRKFKTGKKYFAVDWPTTLKLGKRIPLTNLHSFGHGFKLEFFKNPKIKPLLAYKLNAHRNLNRSIAKIVKTTKYPYIELDKNYFNKRFNIENYLKN